MPAAALALTVSLPGLDPLTVALSRMRTEIGDWTPFWRDRFAPAFYRNTLESFVTEGGSTGDRWAPLSAPYAAWKQRRYPNTGILVRSGALKASLLGPDAPFAIFRPTSTSLEIGSSLPYGLVHQVGSPATHLPQRPPLRVTPAFMTVMGKALQQFVQQAWTTSRSGFASVVANDGISSSGAGGGGLL